MTDERDAVDASERDVDHRSNGPNRSDVLRLRRYRDADAERVWAVHEAALRASPLEFVADAPADAALREVETAYLQAGGEFLVGEVAEEEVADGGVDAVGEIDDVCEVVATGGYLPLDDRTVELRHVRVHPEHQRRGYGRRLVRALEARARDAGYERAELETVEQLRAAIALYRDAGYDVVDREAHPATGDELLTLRREL